MSRFSGKLMGFVAESHKYGGDALNFINRYVLMNAESVSMGQDFGI